MKDMDLFQPPTTQELLMVTINLNSIVATVPFATSYSSYGYPIATPCQNK
ncbi:hypothetical protein HYC85_006679 [Camellia sinensis]|uniref:Uncharacterized protein n=1 Tax=Camellia sinensis TaxID=4442 RepID=A0A7J7HLT8_CAMSI|nr:hypothetical protein HYC85_006679 [Camellia sinensis]